MSEQNGISTMGWVGIIGGGILALTVVPRLLGGLFGGGEEEGEEQGGGLFSIGNLLMLAVAGVAGWFGYQHFFGQSPEEKLADNIERLNAQVPNNQPGFNGQQGQDRQAYNDAVSAIVGVLIADGVENDADRAQALNTFIRSNRNGGVDVQDAALDAAQILNTQTGPAEVAAIRSLTATTV